MTILWLILWVFADTPPLTIYPSISGWTVFLAIALITDMNR